MDEVTEKPALTDSEIAAAVQLLADGVEFDKTRNCLLVWFNLHYGVGFVQGRDGWFALHPAKERSHHRSFHEMLQVLLVTYVNGGGE